MVRASISAQFFKLISSKLYVEVINDDGSFRQDVFFNSSGTKYIAAAFHAARAADPHAKLYANDFNIEGPGPKVTAYHNLIKCHYPWGRCSKLYL